MIHGENAEATLMKDNSVHINSDSVTASSNINNKSGMQCNVIMVVHL